MSFSTAREGRTRGSGVGRITYAVLGVTCILAAEASCGSQAIVLGSVGDDATVRQLNAEVNRICNPAPMATMEDMRLAVVALQDTTKMAHWRNVAWYLGTLGFPECFEPLRNFVWGGHAHNDSMHFMFDAISSAQATIGHVASSNPQALHYLIESTNPDFWKSLPWRESRMAGPEFRLAMSKTSIRALGVSGASEARQMLARLRQWPYREAQRASIEEAIQTHHRVSVQRRLAVTPPYLSLLHLREILPPTTDSTSLVGAWRWMRSAVGSVHVTPPACGWSRTLYLEGDSTYSFWEQDSVGKYRICGGRFIVHAATGQAKGLWIEFQGWAQRGRGTYWPQFTGPDLLRLREGGIDGVDQHGSAVTFVREEGAMAAPDTVGAKVWPPPRVLRVNPDIYYSYYVELPWQLERVRTSLQVRQLDLSHSRALVPKGYDYTHYQTPSGVIGDFDGDSLADVAIYGHDGNYQNTIICLLSNRGLPQGKVAWQDPVPSGSKYSRPLCYLELCPSGRSLVNSKGIRTVLATDAIYRISTHGDRSILHYVNGGFHVGKGTPGLEN